MKTPTLEGEGVAVDAEPPLPSVCRAATTLFWERERGESKMILGLGFGLLNFYIGRDQSGVSIRSDGSSFSRVRPNAIARPPTRNKFTLGRLSCSSPILRPPHGPHVRSVWNKFTLGPFSWTFLFHYEYIFLKSSYHVKLNFNHIIFLYLL